MYLVANATASSGLAAIALASAAQVADLDEAVQQASSLAEPGDVVLLSPACASFDMFRDYAHRGETY